MAQDQEKAKTEKKPLNVMFLATLGFAVVNLIVVGLGTFLVYKSTLGWTNPSLTEESLRKPASVLKQEARLESSSHGAEASEGHGASGEHDPLVPYLHRLEKFTVNLQGEPRKTILLEMTFEMLDETSFEEVMDVTRLPKIRDKVNSLLNETQFAEIETLQGKLFLKDRIAQNVNKLMDQGVVRDIYFSQFVVK